MTQLEGLTILLDAARQMPETPHLRRALKWADKRLEVLQARKRNRDARGSAQRATGTDSLEELARCAQANPERFKAAGRCPCCGLMLGFAPGDPPGTCACIPCLRPGNPQSSLPA